MKVGEIYQSEAVSKAEGPSLEFTRDRMNLVLQLGGITEAEVKAFQDSPLRLGLHEAEQILFLLLEIPGVIEWSDAPYSPWTVSSEKWPELKFNGSGPRLELTVLLVELKSRVVLAVKTVPLSEEFTHELVTRIGIQKNSRLSPEECLKRISKVQKKIPTEKMVREAVVRQ